MSAYCLAQIWRGPLKQFIDVKTKRAGLILVTPAFDRHIYHLTPLPRQRSLSSTHQHTVRSSVKCISNQVQGLRHQPSPDALPLKPTIKVSL